MLAAEQLFFTMVAEALQVVLGLNYLRPGRGEMLPGLR